MKHITLAVLALTCLGGCATQYQPVAQRNSQLTQGNVQMTLVVGKTTKAEVLEVFGAPNITTRDGKGNEVWTYQRAAQVSQGSGQENYWTVVLAGQRNYNSGFETSSSMITLIIKFGANDVVSDFNSRTSNF